MEVSKFEEAKKMLQERLKLETLDENLPLKDLGLDSLDVVEMCLDFEDKFGIQFETEELSSLKTIGDLLIGLQEKIG